jgi:hypothetical protein
LSHSPPFAQAVLDVPVQLPFSGRRAPDQRAICPAHLATDAALIIVTHDAVEPAAEAVVARGCGVAVDRVRVWRVEPVPPAGVRVEVVDAALTAGRETGRFGCDSNRSRPEDGAGGRHGVGKGRK